MGKSAVIYEFGINLQAETMLTAKEIASQIGGILDLPKTAVTITNAAKLEEGDANSLGFLSNPKYEQALYETNCGAVIVPKDFKPQHPISAVLIHHDNPYFAFVPFWGNISTQTNIVQGLNQTISMKRPLLETMCMLAPPHISKKTYPLEITRLSILVLTLAEM